VELVTRFTVGLALALAAGTVALAAEPPHEQAHAAHHGEPYPGPHRYERVAEPKGWNQRPAGADIAGYRHNFQAPRTFRIGVYRRPAGWHAHRWAYGEILPRPYWAAPYIIADYWLFSLEVPPVGYEWVRDDSDALLVSVQTGEIVQVVYGVFG